MNEPVPAPERGSSGARLASISILSMASGAPLGLVYIAVPGWMALQGVDIKTIGLITLAQAPWGFKFLWSPLMDRYAPPFLGRKRGWMFGAQLIATIGIVGLGATAANFDVGMVAGLSLLIAFAGASFDIAYDAYAVEVLDKSEFGFAVGMRSAMYRVALLVAGNALVSLGPTIGWRVTLFLLAVVYAAFLPVTWLSPDPRVPPEPVTSWRGALWDPFVGLLSRARSLEFLAFVTLYRMADSLAAALTTPFLIERGYSAVMVGGPRGVVTMGATIAGTVGGGILSKAVGTSRALWICGVLQAASILGLIAIAVFPVNNALMFVALGVEATCNGLAWGAFGVLLLQMTDKRFSATQYALFSSLVGLTRTIVGPIAGVLADALGWRDFFIVSIFCALPGMVLLQRFAPWGADLSHMSAETAQSIPPGPPWGRATLIRVGLGACVAFAAFGLLATAGLRALKVWRIHHDADLIHAMSQWEGVDLAGSILLGLTGGLAVAAYLAARGRRTEGQSASLR